MSLVELRLHDVSLIRSAIVPGGTGFGVLTGESGAGKSLSVSALRFVLGGKPDRDLLGAGAESAHVGAVFEQTPELAERLAALGVGCDEEYVTLSREISRTGRSTCRVNGGLVSQAVLREVGELLVEVTLQGASHRILRRPWQRQVVDGAGGDALAQRAAAMATAYAAWRDAAQALERAREDRRRSALEVENARALVAELDPLGLREGEDDELATERLRLRHAASIAAALSALATAAGGGDDEGGAADTLARALPGVEEFRAVDPRVGDLAAEAAELEERLRELATGALRTAGTVEVDAARLAEVEERLDVLARLRRRHGSIAAALHDLDRARDVVAAAEGEEMLGRLEEAASAAEAAACAAASALSAARERAARSLERAVEERLRRLELPHARFRIVLSRTAGADGLRIGDDTVRCTAAGVDEIEFRLAANRQGVPLPLDEGPSGGELSRLALALAAASAGSDATALVLDEVDTGIGGETAARVGDLLAEIGRHRQVLAITHRPEIAARASWHLLASKREGAAGTETSLTSLDGETRVVEIARLMSGRTTDAALARARELLGEGGDARSRRAG